MSAQRRGLCQRYPTLRNTHTHKKVGPQGCKIAIYIYKLQSLQIFISNQWFDQIFLKSYKSLPNYPCACNLNEIRCKNQARVLMRISRITVSQTPWHTLALTRSTTFVFGSGTGIQHDEASLDDSTYSLLILMIFFVYLCWCVVLHKPGVPSFSFCLVRWCFIT